MFIGHYGLAFGIKKAAPEISLLTLFVAVEFVDILWPFLLLTGIEKVKISPGITEVVQFSFEYYPYTHSLLMGAFWALLAGIIYRSFTKDLKSAVIVGLAVLSHWFLDLVVHIPDLPLTPFGTIKVGFGLWNSLALTLLLESVIFFTGVYLYAKNTKAVNAKGKWGLWVLVSFFVLANLFNMFGPPPEDSVIVMFFSFAILQLILLSLAHVTDKNRVAVVN